MKNSLFTLVFLSICSTSYGQLNPAISHWLQNTTETGTYYISGNATLIENNILVNCQKVEYSDDFVYVTATGVPAYPTGPFQDGNPSQASNQDAIFKIPLNPEENPGTPIATNGGNIGIFINGVALFDFRDGVGWNPNTNALCGGPGNPPCPGGPMASTDWSRDAIPAEKSGFDCSKGHPAMGNYHHHQNPSAFKLDLETVSTICNLYDADGLYSIDSTKHAPLLGYAYDGFPIYGAYGYKNVDGTGGIVRIKSSYQLRNITERNTSADGSSVDNGPDVSDTYPLGYFREDYEFIEPASTDEDYLDEHNGRFAVTPEYPEGSYAYYGTVDADWVSTYPYIVGPTFKGNATNRKVDSVTETTTVYTSTTSIKDAKGNLIDVNIFPNPASDLMAIQIHGVVNEAFDMELIDMAGKIVNSTQINKGSTIGYFDLQTIYSGTYLVRIFSENGSVTKKVVVE